MITERQEGHLDAICARLGEQFVDYLVIVRPANRGISWRSSEPSWAMGAAERYINGVRMHDTIEQSEDYRRQGGAHE